MEQRLHFCADASQHLHDLTKRKSDDITAFTQVGGNHYQKYKIQPVEFIMKNNVPYVEGNVIKYVMRFRDKNGLEDLLKARQYLNMLIAAEYPNHKLND